MRQADELESQLQPLAVGGTGHQRKNETRPYDDAEVPMLDSERQPRGLGQTLDGRRIADFPPPPSSRDSLLGLVGARKTEDGHQYENAFGRAMDSTHSFNQGRGPGGALEDHDRSHEHLFGYDMGVMNSFDEPHFRQGERAISHFGSDLISGVKRRRSSQVSLGSHFSTQSFEQFTKAPYGSRTRPRGYLDPPQWGDARQDTQGFLHPVAPFQNMAGDYQILPTSMSSSSGTSQGTKRGEGKHAVPQQAPLAYAHGQDGSRIKIELQQQQRQQQQQQQSMNITARQHVNPQYLRYGPQQETALQKLIENAGPGSATSFEVFMTFIKVTPDGELDTSPILSKKCYDVWMRTRRGKPENPPRAFKDSVKTIVKGSNRCRPFPEMVEKALLHELRKTKVWPCFQDTEGVNIGARGWKITGHHEAKAASRATSQRSPQESSPNGSQDLDFLFDLGFGGPNQGARR